MMRGTTTLVTSLMLLFGCSNQGPDIGHGDTPNSSATKIAAVGLSVSTMDNPFSSHCATARRRRPKRSVST